VSGHVWNRRRRLLPLAAKRPPPRYESGSWMRRRLAIVGSATDILDGVQQVLVYNVIWFSRAIVALAIQLPPGGVPRWPERPPLDAQAPAAVVCADPPRTNAPQIGFWVASHGEVRP